MKEGEFFGFLGPNGAGKSTTLKVLTTMLRKAAGLVTVAGHDLDNEPEAIRNVIGVQSQETRILICLRARRPFESNASRPERVGQADNHIES